MVAIEGNGDATEAEVPATELQWGDGDSQRCEGETEGGMEGKGGRGRGRERRRRISVLYFYLLADAHDRERDGVEQQKIPSRDRASDGRTDSDGIVSGIIVGQNIRTFFISKAKEREGERERMEERVRARGGKRGTPKREGGQEK